MQVILSCGSIECLKVVCPLWVGGELLPQVEGINYLRVLFTREGRMGHKIGRQIGATSAVMRLLYRSVVVERELKLGWGFSPCLLLYQSVFDQDTEPHIAPNGWPNVRQLRCVNVCVHG